MRLKKLRLESGMTQEMLADKTGISRINISKIENDKEKVVTSKTLNALAKAFDMSIDELLYY